MAKSKPPLKLYIIWHHNFSNGLNYARQIYLKLTRNINDPLSRGLGIPVFFRSKEVNDHTDFKIDYTSAQNVVLVIFLEENLVADEKWQDHLESIAAQCEINPDCIIFPVAFDETSFNISHKISPKNFIRLMGITDEATQMQTLIYMLTHELSRLLYGLQRTSEVLNVSQSPSPVQLFISHAKKDGLDTANLLNEYIQRSTPLKTFFDANDIATGYEFSSEIEANIQNSVLLVICSDSYSSREWCRREIILAKEYNRPIVVLNILTNGEDRSFPYMANVKTIRGKTPINEQEIITYTLLETLRLKYQELYILYLCSLFNLTVNRENVLSYPPELLSLLYMENSEDNIVIYPDPPLSNEELEILQRLKSDVRFVTPLLLPITEINNNNIKPLNNMKIGISISEDNSFQKNNNDFVHLQDAMIEIAKYLLVCGSSLAYGGSVYYSKEFNLMDSLIEMVRSYNTEHKDYPKKIYNYVAYSPNNLVTTKLKATYSKNIKFVDVPSIARNQQNYPEEEKYLYSRNLTAMRETMNSETDARIFMGGKIDNFKGKYPGILEEAYLAMKSGNPIYLIGIFGGATQLLIDCLLSKEPEELTQAYQFQNPEYQSFFNYYNFQASNDGIDLINYDVMTDFFKAQGIGGLKNGLTEEENETLFTTDDIAEVITLILKGLTKSVRKQE